jgi:hypothetical protein
MKKTFTTCALALAALLTHNTNAQTLIWGAGSTDATIDSIGKFATTFNNTNAWQQVAVTPNALWTRELSGISHGAYATGIAPMSSPTASNGVALFDSDFMDNAGTAGAFGTGTSPAPHRGELHTPRIDLTGYTNTDISATFYLHYRKFNITELSLGFSSDDGATWTNFNIEQGIAVNSIFNTQLIAVNLTGVTAGIANLTQCKLRFVFDGNYYYAMVDDVSLISTPPPCIAPSAPTNTTDTLNTTVCSGSAATLSASGVGSLSWFTDSVGGTAIATDSVFTTGALTADTVFYVQDSTCAVSATRTAVMVMVNQMDSAYLFVPPAPADTLCITDSIVFNPTTTETITADSGLVGNTFYAYIAGDGSHSVVIVNTVVSNCLTSFITTVHSIVVESNCVVGLNKRTLANSVIAPNPNNGTFTITTPNVGVYTLTNELGQVINTFTNSITITNLASGMYILNNASKATHQKIVVTQ